ncbi:MAG: hypothetical protein ACXWKS_08800 [Rhizomicrobium sp.]
MSVLRDVLDELFSMFAADAWLSLGILAVVITAALVAVFVAPLTGGLLLLAGCLGILSGSVLRAAGKVK